MFHRKWLSHNDIFLLIDHRWAQKLFLNLQRPTVHVWQSFGRKIHPWGYWFSNQKRDTFTLFWNARLVNVMQFAITLASHAEVVPMSSWGETRVTSLRTSAAWEQLNFQLSVIKFKQRHLPITRDIDLEVNTWRWQTLRRENECQQLSSDRFSVLGDKARVF